MDKAHYIVQHMPDNQNDWLDLTSPSPVGNHTKLVEIIGFMAEQKDRYPEDRYRLVIRTEIEISEAD